MELNKASAGGGNGHITLALLLAAAFFILATAHSPHSTATTNTVQESSVLKLPTEASSTPLTEKKIFCNKCGPACTLTLPPLCTCEDVLKDCPSWCISCVDVDGGKVCLDYKPNYYCKNIWRKEICCDECGVCTKSRIPKCYCMDVVEECPSWCEKCVDVDNGKVCQDMKINYCKKTCTI